jgi:hypothetical protein
MDLYNFFNRNTTGFLTNFLSELLKSPVKFVEYEEKTRNSSGIGDNIFDSKKESDQDSKITIKVFKFGLNGEVFEFLITPDNRIGFYFHSSNLKPEHSILLGSSLTNSHVEPVRLNLLSIIREYKINQIVS